MEFRGLELKTDVAQPLEKVDLSRIEYKLTTRQLAVFIPPSSLVFSSARNSTDRPTSHFINVDVQFSQFVRPVLRPSGPQYSRQLSCGHTDTHIAYPNCYTHGHKLSVTRITLPGAVCPSSVHLSFTPYLFDYHDHCTSD